MNNRVKGMTADGDCRQEKLCGWKASKKHTDTCDRKCNVCFNTCAHQIIMTNDNEIFQLLLSWCYS